MFYDQVDRASTLVRRGCCSKADSVTIAVGRTFGKDRHTLQESAEIKPLFLATKQIVLLAYALGKLAR
jgi:hypothetical protein